MTSNWTWRVLFDSSANPGFAESDASPDNEQCVDIVWAKAARGVWGLAHVFDGKLYFTLNIMDNEAIRKHFLVPKPKPKPAPKPKGKVAPKHDLKGSLVPA